LVRFFFEDYPGVLAQLRRGVSNRDGESVERAAHRIRGLVSNFDDQRPTEAARRLETSGHSRNFDDAVSDLAELEKGIAYLSGALTPFRGPAR
jgi:HPt (histidine-containing phosphotransfer) domain-containing protein